MCKTGMSVLPLWGPDRRLALLLRFMVGRHHGGQMDDWFSLPTLKRLADFINVYFHMLF